MKINSEKIMIKISKKKKRKSLLYYSSVNDAKMIAERRAPEGYRKGSKYDTPVRRGDG